jgi:hypothetical protein
MLILRLGLGADPSAVHAQIAAETKLRNQLMPSKKKRALNGAIAREEEARVASTSRTISKMRSGTSKMNGNGITKEEESEESDDEEESRSRAIKPMQRTITVANVTRKKAKPVTQALLPTFSSTSSVTSTSNSTSIRSPSSKLSSLPTPESVKSHLNPFKADHSPVASTSLLFGSEPILPPTKNHQVSAVSFYGTSSKSHPPPIIDQLDPATTSIPAPGLTKKERKRERKKEKLESNKRLRLNGENLASQSEESDTALVNRHLGRLGIPPFAPGDSSAEEGSGVGVGMTKSNLLESDMEDSNDNDRMGDEKLEELAEVAHEMDSTKKKKKKKKKKKVGNAEENDSSQILQLTART